MDLLKKSLFGTSGIRGNSETLFTDQFCFDIGRTFAKYLTEKNFIGDIAIGMDPRGSSPRIKSNIEKGLWFEKREIFDQGAAPVPSMCYILQTNPSYVGSLMITGSHIKANLNGVKFFIGKEEISKIDEQRIQEIYYSLKDDINCVTASPAEIHSDYSAVEEYREMLSKLASSQFPRWKVAVDCANGAQTMVMPDLLRDLGLEVIEVNCNMELDFIARDTDTDDQAEIEELRQTIISQKCDFGIAFDGDGDRVVFLNEKGDFIQGEYTCGLIARDSNTESIVTTVSASQLVEKLGKKVYRTQVGSPFIVSKMKEVNSLFGFEANGGAASAEVMYTRDGGVTSIKVLNLFSKFNGKFSDMIGQLPKYYMSRTKMDYEWSQKDAIVNKARSVYGDKTIDETDGLKIWVDDTTWMLLRSSANAPEFRIFAESDSEEKSKKLLQEGVDLVKSAIASS